MAEALLCSLEVIEFELQQSYYIHFRKDVSINLREMRENSIWL